MIYDTEHFLTYILLLFLLYEIAIYLLFFFFYFSVEKTKGWSTCRITYFLFEQLFPLIQCNWFINNSFYSNSGSLALYRFTIVWLKVHLWYVQRRGQRLVCQVTAELWRLPGHVTLICFLINKSETRLKRPGAVYLTRLLDLLCQILVFNVLYVCGYQDVQ